MRSALVLASTIASSPGSERVMLNGFDAAAGPSPRIEGTGAAVCAASVVVASAATHSDTQIRMLRSFMGGFYRGGPAVPKDKRRDVVALCLALGEAAYGLHHLLE